MADKIYTVIVADDEQIIAGHIAKKIAAASNLFKVSAVVSNGKEVIKEIKKCSPDVVFTDIRMPAMDGLEVAEYINDNHPNIKTIIVSGYDDFEYAKRSIHHQVFAYILKPVSAKELSQVMARLAVALDTDKSLRLDSLGTEELPPAVIVDLIKDYLKKHYATEINFNDLAREMHYSPSYLSKLFSAHAGQTLVKYLTSIRINAAQLLLRDSEIPVSDVGKLVGYPDPYYFSRIYKKHTGKSPAVWREDNQSGI